MRMTHQDDRYYRITSLYPASFLFAKGAELVNIDKISNHKKAIFVFRNHPKAEDWLSAFQSNQERLPEAMVDGRKLVNAIKALKDMLYQDTF